MEEENRDGVLVDIKRFEYLLRVEKEKEDLLRENRRLQAYVAQLETKNESLQTALERKENVLELSGMEVEEEIRSPSDSTVFSFDISSPLLDRLERETKTIEENVKKTDESLITLDVFTKDVQYLCSTLKYGPPNRQNVGFDVTGETNMDQDSVMEEPEERGEVQIENMEEERDGDDRDNTVMEGPGIEGTNGVERALERVEVEEEIEESDCEDTVIEEERMEEVNELEVEELEREEVEEEIEEIDGDVTVVQGQKMDGVEEVEEDVEREEAVARENQEEGIENGGQIVEVKRHHGDVVRVKGVDVGKKKEKNRKWSPPMNFDQATIIQTFCIALVDDIRPMFFSKRRCYDAVAGLFVEIYGPLGFTCTASMCDYRTSTRETAEPMKERILMSRLLRQDIVPRFRCVIDRRKGRKMVDYLEAIRDTDGDFIYDSNFDDQNISLTTNTKKDASDFPIVSLGAHASMLGYSTETTERSTIRSIYGRATKPELRLGEGYRSFVGHRTIGREDSLWLSHLWENDEMNSAVLEKMIEQWMEEGADLELKEEGHILCIIVNGAHLTRKNIEWSIQTIFDTVGSRGSLVLIESAHVVLAEREVQTGVVIDFGELTTTYSVICDGHTLTRYIVPFGGKHMSKHLQQLLSGAGIGNLSNEDASNIKESLSLLNEVDMEYSTSDGRSVVVPSGINKMFGLALFEPKKYADASLKEPSSVVDCIRRVVENCGVVDKTMIWSNIVFTGGVCEMNGFSEQLDTIIAGCGYLRQTNFTVGSREDLWRSSVTMSKLMISRGQTVTKKKFEAEGVAAFGLITNQ